MDVSGKYVNDFGFFKGIHYFFQGLGLIFKPNLRRYIVIPILCNAIILVIIFAGLAFYLYYHFTPFWASYPKWIITILGWLFWSFYSFMTLMVSSFIFTLLTNIIASPMYGLLADATTKLLLQNNTESNLFSQNNMNTASNTRNPDSIQNNSTENPSSETWLKTALLTAPRTLAREARKLLYFLPWIILCLLLLILPFAWPIFPFVWGVVLAWIIGIQYIDYQPDNQRIPFKEVLVLLKQEVLTILGFGAIVSLAMMIPGANLFVPPAAVAGGTALWLALSSHKKT
jgi:CysZ protein